MKIVYLSLLLALPLLLDAQYSKPARIFGEGQVDVQTAVGLFSYLPGRPPRIDYATSADGNPVDGSQTIQPGPHRRIFYFHKPAEGNCLILFVVGGTTGPFFWAWKNGFHYTRIDKLGIFYGGLFPIVPTH